MKRGETLISNLDRIGLLAVVLIWMGYQVVLWLGWCALFWPTADDFCCVVDPMAWSLQYATAFVAGIILLGFIYAGVTIAVYGTTMYRAGAISSKTAYPENGWQ
jgi:hypothetical protein